MGPLTCFHSECITVSYLHNSMSNCRRIRISVAIPIREILLYFTFSTAYFILTIVYIVCHQEVMIFSLGIMLYNSHCLNRDSTTLASSHFKKELEETNHLSKTSKHHPTKRSDVQRNCVWKEKPQLQQK